MCFWGYVYVEAGDTEDNTMMTKFLDELTYPDPAGKVQLIYLLQQYRRRLPLAATVSRGEFLQALRAAGYILARDCTHTWVLVGRSRHGGKHYVVTGDRVRVVR